MTTKYPSRKQVIIPISKKNMNIVIEQANTHICNINKLFKSYKSNIVMIDLIASRCSTHGLLLCFILLHVSNGSVSASLVGHVLYSTELMSATCIPHWYLMVHRYIYSRYSSVFLILYQLYHSLPSSTPISSSSLYLSIATWVTPQDCNIILYCLVI